MQQLASLENDMLLRWFEPLGIAARLVFTSLNPGVFLKFDWRYFRSCCVWMGPESLLSITIASLFVALALTLQAVTEMRYMRIQDLSGAVIAIGLLREIGPITVSLAWAARITAYLTAEGRETFARSTDDDYVAHFFLPSLVAGLCMGIPLSLYGLVIGYLSAAFFAPTLGVSSTNDFLEISRLYIQDKDVLTYFVKLDFVNPTIAVLVGCSYALTHYDSTRPVFAKAITALFITGFIANWICTYVVFGHE